MPLKRSDHRGLWLYDFGVPLVLINRKVSESLSQTTAKESIRRTSQKFSNRSSPPKIRKERVLDCGSAKELSRSTGDSSASAAAHARLGMEHASPSSCQPCLWKTAKQVHRRNLWLRRIS